MTLLRTRARDWLTTAGWDLRRVDTPTHPVGSVRRLLRHFDVDLVFDVGANVGQYGLELRSGGYRGRIVSFEPLSQAHPTLVRNARGDASWTVAPRMAIGDTDGEIRINVSANSVSSSVLGFEAVQRTVAPQAAYSSEETVPIRRLDSVAGEYLAGSKRAFLKLDVQGFEDKVLDGAPELLRSLVGIQCELSLEPIYQGQVLWLPMIERLQSAGFAVHQLVPVFGDPESGRLLQLDAVMFRGRPT